MKIIKSNTIFLITLAMVFASCADLNVDNLNNPDAERVQASASDLTNLAGGLFRAFYVDTYDTPSPIHNFSVMSDNTSCSWGNYGMRDTSSEPRAAWDNSVSYPYENSTSTFFNDMYATLSNANDVLSAIDRGLDFGTQVPMLQAWVKFNQAMVFSNIALTFDQGYIVTEASTIDELSAPVLVSSATIAAKANELFDEVITLSSANTFDLPDAAFLGVSADNVLLGQLANSYAARLLAYMPRTAAENDAVNWNTVKTYAMAGITADFNILMDDVTWLNDYKWVQAYPGWGRSDMRIANMMDPSYPAYNANGEDYAAPDSTTIFDNANIDDRLWTDFEHLSSNNFRPERGLYHFSSFRVARYDDYISTWDTYLPEFRKAELDMILAEAHYELNELPQAIAIINAGSRNLRGGLPDVAAVAADVDAAIHHERQVELTVTMYGSTYFDMRKRDLLQTGSFLQMPIPAKTLELLQAEKPYYTFGGSNTFSSTGGWR